ncbi:MAG: hypothetical protein KBA42_06420 [Bacteroidales bacterium]|nr:hypothetical protein [Bacteroidales bacterium]MBP9028565.1 hypothetical protein [Bacteroidales bacterium]NMC99247.1 hypothetical protein [Bacteroidales bacterium]HRR11042.1 hypothetical protein [Tenuifilum sp.]
MKKSRVKIVLTSLFLMGFLTIGYFASRTIANTPINPECPNGCKEGSGGCYCYQHYKDLREANWKVRKYEKNTINENW